MLSTRTLGTTPGTGTETIGKRAKRDHPLMCAEDMFWQGYVANPAMSGISPPP